MKQFAFLLSFILIAPILYSEAPQKINYQAIIRDSDGHLMQNQEIGIEISIIENSEDGSIIYTETQTVTSNSNVLINLYIVNGSSTD
ncbi:hypothetical protein [Saccharicrinis sp. 156]|uniref:hypothetical protein n=1 Tax=Saccharicrinis sp. 156 TaxID=3417574 RepID=UPI003D34495C